MNLQTLLENAHLEALGLLDEQERAAFDAAFAASPPAIQAHVRDEQARWAQLDFLLPSVEIPFDLRDRVLDRVRAEIIAAEAAAASIASGGGFGGIYGNVYGGTSDPYQMQSSKRVTPMWRAGAIGLLGVVGVLAAAFLNVLSINSQMRTGMTDFGAPREILSALDGQDRINDVLFDARTSLTVFSTVSADFAGQASIRTNPDWSTATVNVQNLPELATGESYRLVIVDDSDKVMTELAEFGAGKKSRTTASVSNSQLRAGTRLAIIAAKGADLTNFTTVMTARLG